VDEQRYKLTDGKNIYRWMDNGNLDKLINGRIDKTKMGGWMEKKMGGWMEK